MDTAAWSMELVTNESGIIDASSHKRIKGVSLCPRGLGDGHPKLKDVNDLLRERRVE